jgi:hypothetical protein
MLQEATQKLGTNTNNDWSTSPIALRLQAMEQRKCNIYKATLEAVQIKRRDSMK